MYVVVHTILVTHIVSYITSESQLNSFLYIKLYLKLILTNFQELLEVAQATKAYPHESIATKQLYDPDDLQSTRAQSESLKLMNYFELYILL